MFSQPQAGAQQAGLDHSFTDIQRLRGIAYRKAFDIPQEEDAFEGFRQVVNRLVELGQLTAEEAENHPRKNELQQAIGGQPDVEPGVYHGKMSPGDWVIVCSDGLTNHVNNRDLQQMLQSEAVSAEMAARRLVNLTLIEGATDNVTVVAVRAT